MNIFTMFWDTSATVLTTTTKKKNEMAKKVISEHTHNDELIYICGADVAYRNNIAYCSAVLMNKNTMEIMESVNVTLKVKHPYVPGFFVLRESEVIINILKSLRNRLDLILIYANVVLHFRRCGLASY